jgi:hypothetical protein
MDVYIQVSVFTQAEGFALARAIISRIYTLTHGPLGGAFTLGGGFANVLTLFDNRQELEQVQATLIQHIADRYKLFVQG